MEFEHIPVLLNETIEGLQINPDGIYVDGTVGGGGHSAEICKRLGSGRLIAVDQDTEALEAAREHLAPWAGKVSFHHANFERLPQVLDEEGVERVDGILLDIGVSSHQLDEGERGFSYHADAPLDMRMNQDNPTTAADIVNGYSAEELTRIFYEYGEERWAKRIAEFIVTERAKEPIETTGRLTEVIKMAVPKAVRMQDKHPSRRVFQALRIEVNRELDVLKNVLNAGVERLKPGGRFCIITFHSLEDRIVKNAFRDMARGCICPPEFPVCVCGHKAVIRLVNRKPIEASKQELARNPRARSAKLRIAEKILEG